MKLNFFTSLSQTGYGIAGYNICKELQRQNVDLSIFLPEKSRGVIDFPDLQEVVSRSIDSHDKHAPFIKLWHQFELLYRVGCGHYYAWPIFELDRFHPTELSHLNIPDDLIVCSDWAASIIKEQTGRNSYVIPLGVNQDIFQEHTRVGDKYVFYNIGKLEKRKGHDILPQIFSKAFEKTDNVELHMLITNPFLSQEQHNEYIREAKATKLGDKIHFFNRLETDKDVAEFMQNRDCGVFPSRAEGWNMELLESLACGKPVITTDYSAHTQYCNADNSYLIDITEKEEAYDGKWFFKQGRWAKLGYEQLNQLIEHMRYCYNNRPDNKNGTLTAKEFTWTNTATQMLRLIHSKSTN